MGAIFNLCPAMGLNTYNSYECNYHATSCPSWKV